MLSTDANERLTRVGPGTPTGELLRRYWHPIATITEFQSEPVLAVKLLGQNLALYRIDGGNLGLVAQRRPHRGQDPLDTPRDAARNVMLVIPREGHVTHRAAEVLQTQLPAISGQ